MEEIEKNEYCWCGSDKKFVDCYFPKPMPIGHSFKNFFELPDKVQHEKRNNLRKMPSTDLISFGNNMDITNRRFLLDKVAQLTDENSLGRSDSYLQFTTILKYMLKRFLDIDSKIISGNAKYYGEKVTHSFEHFWIETELGETIDGNVDSMKEDPFRPFKLEPAPFWGQSNLLPRDRLFYKKSELTEEDENEILESEDVSDLITKINSSDLNQEFNEYKNTQGISTFISEGEIMIAHKYYNGQSNPEVTILSPSSFLVFIDETGDESLTDDKYPIFGLGGCGINAKDYFEELANPWKELKRVHFGNEVLQLHASEIQKLNPNQEQLKAIGNFFLKQKFGRFASIFIDNIGNDGVYYSTLSNLISVICNISINFEIGNIVFIFEESQRGDKLAKKFLPIFEVIAADEKYNESSVPILKYFMSKKEIEAGLEVADFIMHAAGNQVVKNFLKCNKKFRKDFDVTFRLVDKKFTGFFVAGSVEIDKQALKKLNESN